MSVANNRMVVGTRKGRELYMYQLTDGCQINTIVLPDNDLLFDVKWTPNGNIVYTSFSSESVVLLNDCGEKIKRTELKHKSLDSAKPRGLSVSSDNIIYLADIENGLYQSKDNGLKWSLVFRSTTQWKFRQAVKVTTYSTAVCWWVLVRKSEEYEAKCYSLRIYTVNQSGFDATWRKMAVPRHVRITRHSKLNFDGEATIFLTDYERGVIHKFDTRSEQYFEEQKNFTEDKLQCIACTKIDDRVTIYIGHQRNGQNGVVSYLI